MFTPSSRFSSINFECYPRKGFPKLKKIQFIDDGDSIVRISKYPKGRDIKYTETSYSIKEGNTLFHNWFDILIQDENKKYMFKNASQFFKELYNKVSNKPYTEINFVKMLNSAQENIQNYSISFRRGNHLTDTFHSITIEEGSGMEMKTPPLALAGHR